MAHRGDNPLNASDNMEKQKMLIQSRQQTSQQGDKLAQALALAKTQAMSGSQNQACWQTAVD